MKFKYIVCNIFELIILFIFVIAVIITGVYYFTNIKQQYNSTKQIIGESHHETL